MFSFQTASVKLFFQYKNSYKIKQTKLRISKPLNINTVISNDCEVTIRLSTTKMLMQCENKNMA